MSVHVSSWVWKHAPAKGNHLLVMLALADVASDEGVAWPSQAYLATKTRLSLPTVKRTIKALRESGVVVSDASLGRSNVYRIVMDEAAGGSSVHDPAGDQSDTSVNLIPVSNRTGGVDHSYELGDSSTVTPYTSEIHQDTPEGDVDVFEMDIPKGTRTAVVLPRPFIVTAHMREWAGREAASVGLDAVTAEFVAYWREGEGKGKRKKNWPLTWMNRMRAVHARNVEHGWKPASEGRKVIRNGRVVA